MFAIHKAILTLLFASFFLFSFTPAAFAHEGHDHSEESPIISTAQEQASPEAAVLQTATQSEEQQQQTTPLWIPIAAVIGGIVGIALLYTRVLHPKNKE